MQRIAFITLFFCIAGFVSMAQQPPVPPKRTSDPVAFRPHTAVSLPIRAGGGSARPATMSRTVMPLRSSDGGSKSGNTGAKLATGRATMTPQTQTPQTQGNSKPLRPSDLAIKQDSAAKH
jgi:hypothetical protein